MNKASRLTSKLGRRLRILVGIGGLVAMAALPFFAGVWKSDTGSSTTVIAQPTTTRNSASAAPNPGAPPFSKGWSGGGPFNGGGWADGKTWWGIVAGPYGGG